MVGKKQVLRGDAELEAFVSTMRKPSLMQFLYQKGTCLETDFMTTADMKIAWTIRFERLLTKHKVKGDHKELSASDFRTWDDLFDPGLDYEVDQIRTILFQWFTILVSKRAFCWA
jgi:hypothetical protein